MYRMKLNRRIRNRTFGGVRGRHGNVPPTRFQLDSVVVCGVEISACCVDRYKCLVESADALS